MLVLLDETGVLLLSPAHCASVSLSVQVSRSLEPKVPVLSILSLSDSGLNSSYVVYAGARVSSFE